MQSNIISQEAETLEKPNVFDIESVTYRKTKNCYQITNPRNYYSTTKKNQKLYRVKSG